MSPRMSASLFCLAFLVATPASAVTVANGVVLFNQADALAGNVTPGDAPGFPVTLSATGSYRLAGNLLPTAGKDGIEVTGPEVTIDMFGFRLAGSGAALNGVVGRSRALTVKNGTIRGFTENGIITYAEFLTVDAMRINDNIDAGVRDYYVTGTAGFSAITNSNISRNGTGIACNNNCRIESNIIGANRGYGVYTPYDGAIVLGNTISNNGAYGIYVPTRTGVGNNTMIGNAQGPSFGSYTPLNPNVCPSGVC